jgi:hypothetical protein
MCSTVMAAGCAESTGGSVKMAGGTDCAETPADAKLKLTHARNRDTRITNTSCKQRAAEEFV